MTHEPLLTCLLTTGSSPSSRKAQPPKGLTVTWRDIHDRLADQRQKKRTHLQADKVCSNNCFRLSTLNDIARALTVRTMMTTTTKAARRAMKLTMKMLTKSPSFSVRFWRSPWSKWSTPWGWGSSRHERRQRVKENGVKLRKRPSKQRRKRTPIGREKDSW